MPKKNKLPTKSFADDSCNFQTNPADEIKFREFVENLPVMFYVVEPFPPFKPIYVSPAFKNLGYPIEEWYANPDVWVNAIHEEDRSRILAETAEAIKIGGGTDYEYRIVGKKGEIHWVRDRSSCVCDETGKVIRWQGLIMDITDRKLAKQDLERREELYRTFTRNIPNTAVLLFDQEMRYTLAEGMQFSRHDYSRAKFEGKTIFEVFPPEISDEWSNYYRRALDGETVCMERRTDDGYFDIMVVPVRNDKDEIFAGMVMWHEITERKNAEIALKDSEERYRNLFENANDLIYVHDLKGNYLSINEATERVFGYTREEALKLNMRQIVAPEHFNTVRRKLRDKIAGGAKQTVYEADCLTKDGRRITLEVNSSAIYKNGVPVAVQGIARDITERKRAEEALKESEEKFRTVAETALDAIITIDENSTILFVNAAAEKVFGYKTKELLGKSLTVLMPERMRRPHQKGLGSFIKTGVRNMAWKAVHLPGLHRDGHEISLELSFAEYKKEGQRFFTSIIRDVTERRRAEQALKESEEGYRDLFENANDLIYTHDLQGNFTSLNRAGEIITGFSREEALKMNISAVVAPEFLEAARQMTMRKLAGEPPTAYELEIINRSGNRVSLELSTRLILQNGQPVGVQGIGRDITERRKADEKLKKSEESYRLLGEGIMHQVWTARPDGKLDYVNGRTTEYFGRTAEQLLEDNWKEVLHPNDLAECVERWSYSLRTGEYYETEFRLLCHDGEYRWHLARATAGRDRQGNIVKWFGTNTDIHDQKLAEAQLNHFARHDHLTNLPNRNEFMLQLKQTIDRAAGNDWSRFAVLFLDLDRFKVINDSLGHAIGDKLLVSIAERLKACVRPGDVVARLGGDEFTILLNRTGSLEDVERVADRLLQRLSEPFKLDNYEVFTSASIGIIVSDGVRRQPEDFLRDADAAMYRAKEAGKARYEIFDREMHVRNMNLLKLETDLRRAVEREEFEVFYQPIVLLETGEIKEFEALLRWRHPEYGLVAPNDFISIAEETGLIIPIGRWILEEACRQTANWQKRFPSHKSLTVSVNLSAKQLMHPNLTAQVREILFDSKLKSHCLQLEVTESTVMEHHDTAQKVLNELQDLGVRLSTDDFGTGYSSLSYLHRFPFDRLKIDRSFISKMDSESKSGAIVRTILLLGQNLNIEVVAEGIESEDQLGQLQTLGCHFGQGYLLSKPVQKSEAEKLLREGVKNFTTPASFIFDGNRKLIEINDVQ